MAKTRKEFRELTISETAGYGKAAAPMLRIQGKWLQELGFYAGDPVLVKCEDGKLIITADKELALRKEELKLRKAEIDAQFEDEKRKLYKQFVAEREANYGR